MPANCHTRKQTRPVRARQCARAAIRRVFRLSLLVVRGRWAADSPAWLAFFYFHNQTRDLTRTNRWICASRDRKRTRANASALSLLVQGLETKLLSFIVLFGRARARPSGRAKTGARRPTYAHSEYQLATFAAQRVHSFNWQAAKMRSASFLCARMQRARCVLIGRCHLHNSGQC